MNNLERDAIFKEKFQNLPKAIQTAITNSNWIEKVRSICTRNSLLLDQAAIVENTVFSIMLGFFHPDEVMKILKESGIDDTTSNKIVTEIDAQIFAPIKNELVEVFNEFESQNIGQTEEDNSLDFLAGETHVDTEEQDRNKILQEIEDMDASTNIENLADETTSETPTEKPVEATTSATGEVVEAKPDTKATEQAPESSPLEKKLSENVAVEPKIVKIDPYREQLE